MDLYRPRRGVLGLTEALIIVNIAVYAAAAFIGGGFWEIDGRIAMLIGQYNLLVLRHGFWWQLITAMFIHVNLLHLGFNMFWLYYLGKQAEFYFGARRYVVVYFLSGLAGNMLTLLLPLNTVSLGASGAVFGLFGALTIYGRRSRAELLPGIVYALLILLLNIGFGVNLLAHAGGLAAGMVLGYIYGRRRTLLGYRYGYSIWSFSRSKLA